MKRILILFSMAAALLLGLTSCEENKTSTYIIQIEDSSKNYDANTFLQPKVSSFISANKDNFAQKSFKGTESEQFANAEPVVPVHPNTSATFSLCTSPDNQNSDSVVNDGAWETVTTRTVTFKEPDSLL